MKQRLRKIIDYAAKGKPTTFAQTMGWTTQYVNNLLNTDCGIGIKPIVAILEHYPELNARWLLLGKGVMLDDTSATLREYIYLLLSIEKTSQKITISQLQRLTTELTSSLARMQGYFDAVNER